ncbi:MAG: NERD domain-containing protein [Chloroflexi bacterium]|nr:MAG: NERD domain-containing protein [Chloroflexota bacterium]
MKVVTDTQLVESRAKWAKRIAPFTLLFLVGGLITNFLSISQPEYFRPTLILLALGFVSAIVSSNLVNNWVREPRADQVLTQILKKFSNDYQLFNYTGPIRHVLIAPDGLYAIVVKNHDGEITVNGRKVSRKFTWKRLVKMFADEGLGSPIAEAENRAAKLAKSLNREFPDMDVPPVKPLLLFSNKEAQVTVNQPDVPALVTSEIKNYLREEGKNRVVSSDVRKKLAEYLGGE